MTPEILVIGATGQIGSELTIALRKKYGHDTVVAMGHKTKPDLELAQTGPYEAADATNKEDDHRVIVKIYRLETCDFNRMYDYIKEDPRYSNLGG